MIYISSGGPALLRAAVWYGGGGRSRPRPLPAAGEETHDTAREGEGEGEGGTLVEGDFGQCPQRCQVGSEVW